MFRSPAAMGAFRATSRAAFLKPSFQPHVGPINAQYAFKWVPSLVFWGATSGVLVTLALSGVPLFKTDVLLKTPVASFYEDKTPDSDKPF
ncbi:Uncharacterized protein MSYG_0325 [Malassezia sympodialis ATCC 42132]|uniref:Uncharacterized protein n=1 Tax=Malassezia sympodialis (strain ATCC 42132) TaxID=1230383 RepID=A0A1M8A0Q9_MALS4|nr:Uncharacterized protein MSYG_0325 [Malassezia sympodialis ATCC 42132]